MPFVREDVETAVAKVAFRAPFASPRLAGKREINDQ